MKKPLVSIILPVYKSEKHLEDILTSLLSQNYKNIEIIAVVDYLRDNSLKILNKFKKKNKKLRVYKNIQTYGLHVTLNRGVRRAKGDYIAFVGNKNYPSIHRISKQVSFLLRNPKIAAVGTQVSIVRGNGRIVERSNFPTSHEEIYKDLMLGTSISPETIMVNKKALPRDVIKFTNDKYPYLFVDLLLKIGIYAEIANLKYHLVSIKLTKRQNTAIKIDKKVSFLKLLVRSAALYAYRPSIKSIFNQAFGISFR